MIWPHPVAAAAAHAVVVSSGSHVELGDLPTWLLAVFAGLALLAAILAYKEQRKASQELAKQVKTQGEALADQRTATAALTRMAELQRTALTDQQAANSLRATLTRQELSATSRRQAEQINFRHQIYEGVIPGMPPSGLYQGVEVTNKSSYPIRDIACRRADGHDQEALRLGLFGAEEDMPPNQVLGDGRKMDLLLAGQNVAFIFPVAAADGEPAPVLRFTDDAKLHWEYDNDLHLELVTERDW